MKITMTGPYRLKEFGDALMRVVQGLAANGIEDVSRVNIYLNIGAQGRPVVLTGPAGIPIDHLAFDEPEELQFVAHTDDLRVRYTAPASQWRQLSGSQRRKPKGS